ncbi:MAG: hypothetical protein AVDCRST_MAG10-2421, partial [uncultured Acidimicrobiales bacterium]
AVRKNPVRIEAPGVRSTRERGVPHAPPAPEPTDVRAAPLGGQGPGGGM